MLRIRIWIMTLGSFLAVSFTLCVVGGLVAPGLPIKHGTLEAVLPGFLWISPAAFFVGLVESFLFGAYAALVLVPLHNYFLRRSHRASAALSVTRTA